MRLFFNADDLMLQWVMSEYYGTEFDERLQKLLDSMSEQETWKALLRNGAKILEIIESREEQDV